MRLMGQMAGRHAQAASGRKRPWATVPPRETGRRQSGDIQKNLSRGSNNLFPGLLKKAAGCRWAISTGRKRRGVEITSAANREMAGWLDIGVD